MLWDITVRCLTKVCGTAAVGRMTEDAWWNDEIRVALNEKKQAYLRKLNIRDLSGDERIRSENDYRMKTKKVKMLVKESSVHRQLDRKGCIYGTTSSDP